MTTESPMAHPTDLTALEAVVGAGLRLCRWFAPLAFAAAVGCGDPIPLEVADSVDLEAYQGEWFEIARLPNRFEEGCSDVTAHYTLNDQGKVDVRNRCTVDGEVDIADGIAVVEDEETNAKLKVSFFWPFFGKYQIMAVDESSYSLVGEPKREFLWVLSRTPEMDADVLDALIDQADAQGFAVDELHFTRHR
jgi:apolipoprotein D and lipocalin family protein